MGHCAKIARAVALYTNMSGLACVDAAQRKGLPGAIQAYSSPKSCNMSNACTLRRIAFPRVPQHISHANSSVIWAQDAPRLASCRIRGSEPHLRDRSPLTQTWWLDQEFLEGGSAEVSSTSGDRCRRALTTTAGRPLIWPASIRSRVQVVS